MFFGPCITLLEVKQQISRCWVDLRFFYALAGLDAVAVLTLKKATGFKLPPRAISCSADLLECPDSKVLHHRVLRWASDGIDSSRVNGCHRVAVSPKPL